MKYKWTPPQRLWNVIVFHFHKPYPFKWTYELVCVSSYKFAVVRLYRILVTLYCKVFVPDVIYCNTFVNTMWLWNVRKTNSCYHSKNRKSFCTCLMCRWEDNNRYERSIRKASCLSMHVNYVRSNKNDSVWTCMEMRTLPAHQVDDLLQTSINSWTEPHPKASHRISWRCSFLFCRSGGFVTSRLELFLQHFLKIIKRAGEQQMFNPLGWKIWVMRLN